MKLPNIYKPKFNFKLIRVGKNNDGGYLVGKKSILNSENLISFGISDDWSFEEQFSKINSSTNIFAYDDVLSLGWLTKNFIKNIKRFLFFQVSFKEFLRTFLIIFKFKNFIKITNYEKKYIEQKDIPKIINNKNKIFFKIDIEGGEYRIFDELIQIKDRIEAIVIELHDIDLHKQKIINFIEKSKLIVTHIHPNNYSRLDNNLNPTCIELTLERSPDKENNLDLILPHILDQKCDPDSPDINFIFEND